MQRHMLLACRCRRQQKCAVKPGSFAIVGRGRLEIVYRTCQSVTGRAALLAPFVGCIGSWRPSALRGKASPDETERVGRGHLIDLHGFPEDGHCCARTASLVQRRYDGHAARVSVMRACIACTCARHHACRVPVSPWPIPEFSDKPDC